MLLLPWAPGLRGMLHDARQVGLVNDVDATDPHRLEEPLTGPAANGLNVEAVLVRRLLGAHDAHAAPLILSCQYDRLDGRERALAEQLPRHQPARPSLHAHLRLSPPARYAAGLGARDGEDPPGANLERLTALRAVRSADRRAHASLPAKT